MISTDDEFTEEALRFFNKIGPNLNPKYSFDIEADAYNYVQKVNIFKYRDHVEAGVLVDILVKFGYIEFDKRINDIRYHKLTEKGIIFIKNIKH